MSKSLKFQISRKISGRETLVTTRSLVESRGLVTCGLPLGTLKCYGLALVTLKFCGLALSTKKLALLKMAEFAKMLFSTCPYHFFSTFFFLDLFTKKLTIGFYFHPIRFQN